jgi:hypothetical protein
MKLKTKKNEKNEKNKNSKKGRKDFEVIKKKMNLFNFFFIKLSLSTSVSKFSLFLSKLKAFYSSFSTLFSPSTASVFFPHLLLHTPYAAINFISILNFLNIISFFSSFAFVSIPPSSSLSSPFSLLSSSFPFELIRLCF